MYFCPRGMPLYATLKYCPCGTNSFLLIFMATFIAATFLVVLCACDFFNSTSDNTSNETNNSEEDIAKEQKQLENEGYVFNETFKWYEKEDINTESGENEILINFSASKPEINSSYEITDDQNRVIFIGKSTKTYTNFNIMISGRYSNLYIELRNFKFSAPVGYAGIDATDVNQDFELCIAASGASSIKGGNGISGNSGTTYDTGRFSAEANSPRNGGAGGNGKSGLPAIFGNSIFINTAKSSTFILYGGNGGAGGNGGNGGNGGKATYNVDEKLFNCKSGNGGNGGEAGNPGYNPAIGYGASGVNGNKGSTPK